MSGFFYKLSFFNALYRGGEKALKSEYEVLVKFKKMLLEDKKHLRFGDWNQADIEVWTEIIL